MFLPRDDLALIPRLLAIASSLRGVTPTRDAASVVEMSFMATGTIPTIKRTRCKDRGATLQAVMDAAGGDMELVVSTLASDAFKHGACRQILSDEAYSSLFTTSEVEKLEEGASKSEPKLQVFDSAFARKPAPKAG